MRQMFYRPGFSRGRGLVASIVAVALLAGGGLAVRWYWARQSLGWQVARGLELLQSADTPTKVRLALDQWETATTANWQARRGDLVRHLLEHGPLEDARVRLLLTRVAGADYGTRPADWKRWHENNRRIAADLSPQVPRREAVTLRPLWTAPVGLTTWFSTILPLDGQIYVSSLGAEFQQAQDAADGVVRVNGSTGAAELVFTPPPEHRGPRDVLGLAAGDDELFVACANGSVYAIDPNGQPRWHTHAGDPIISPPLTTDLNRDGAPDVVVVTRAAKGTTAKAVALSGRGGRTIWATTVAHPPAGDPLLGATLALGPLRPDAGPDLFVTLPTGDLAVLAPRTGELRGHEALPGGSVAGTLCRSDSPEAGPRVQLADRLANVWSLVAAGRELEVVPWLAPAIRRDETLIAALRTLTGGAGQPPLIIVCPTGDFRADRAAVCGLAPDGVRWRLPVGGAIWATPAVADLNGDGQPELIVATIAPGAEDQAVGVVTIVSAHGHVVGRLELDAPVECSPAVADVDGDNRLEVLIADQSGRLRCYTTTGIGPVEWGLFGGDSHNTRNATNAYAWGQTLFGRQRRWRPP